MTALCLGGTSSLKSGLPLAISMSVPAIGAFMNNIPTRWAVPLAAALGALNFDLTTMCETDPPAMPSIGYVDWVLVNSPVAFSGRDAAERKFVDLITIFLWHEMCRCDNGHIPGAPAAPAAPVGLPVHDPPEVGPSYPTGAPCQEARFTATVPNDGTQRLTARQPLPPGASTVTIDATFDDALAVCSPGLALFVEFFNSAGGVVAPTVACGSSTTPVHHTTGAVPATAATWSWGTLSTNCTAPIPYSADVNFYCGTTPGAPSGPIPQPCPPDQFTLGLLDQILQLVKLIQRQKVPFAYVPGTRHNGVTGNGQIAVQGLLGVSVILTTVPPWLGNIAGDPPELFDAGFVTVGSSDGWHRSVRLDHNPTIVLPIEGSETLIGYSLQVGVVADILELVREP